MRALLAVLASLSLAGCTFVLSEDNARSSGFGSTGSGAQSGSASGSGSSSSSGGPGSDSTSGSGSGSATTGSTTTGASSSSSGTSGSASGASNGSASAASSGSGGGAGSGSGSGGTTAANVPIAIPAAGGMSWFALAISPPGAAHESVAMVSSSDGGSAFLQAFEVDGGSSASAGLPGALPRAVVFDGTSAIVVNQETRQTWTTVGCTLKTNRTGWDCAAGAQVCSTTSNCGEAIDIAGSPGQPVALAVTTAQQYLLAYYSNSTWNICGTSNTGNATQLDVSNGAALVLVNPTSGDLSDVYKFAGLACGPTSLAAPSASGLNSFMVDGAIAVLGGATSDAGYSLFTSDLDGGAPTPVEGQGLGTIHAVAERNGTYAFLTTLLGNGFYVVRQWSDGGSQRFDLRGDDMVEPPQSDGGFYVSRAGRQIAVTSSGAVFFITESGGWYWPAP